MTEQVVFSRRAYTAIVAGTLENISTETGGVFLGHYQDGVWYVIETIDPGPKTKFSSVTLEMDLDYINHLGNKLNKLYNRPLRLLGIWHRHPGSMDVFSSEDDLTNAELLRDDPHRAISALVNIDPHFRITVYALRPSGYSRPGYTRIAYSQDDAAIPEELRRFVSAEEMQERINRGNRTPVKREKTLPAGFFKRILDRVKRECPVATVGGQSGGVPVQDDDLDSMVEAVEEDMKYLAEICAMSLTEEGIFQIREDAKTGKKPVVVELFPADGKIYSCYGKKIFEYRSGLFKSLGEKERG